MKHLLKWNWVLLYTVVLIGAVFFINAAALGDKEESEDAGSEKITLTFRHFWTKEHDRPILKIFEDVVHDFQEKHPNVKINMEGIDQTIHREQKLKSEMVTGTPPDIFVLFGGAEIEPYIRANRLMDMNVFMEQNGLTEQFHDLRHWSKDGHVYGLPIEGHAEPLFFNKTIFLELGLKAPETMDELAVVIERLQQNGIIPFALGNEDRWPAAIYAHYLMDRFAGPELIGQLGRGDEEGATFINEGYLAAYRKLDEWVKAGVFPVSANVRSTEEAISLFTNGRAAMYVNGNWDITLFRNEKTGIGFQNEVGVIPFPGVTVSQKRSAAGGYMLGIGMSANLSAAKQEAAFKLLQTLYTEEVQTRIVYEALRVPAMRIDYDPKRTGPVFAKVIELMEQGDGTFIPYDNVLSPEVKKVFLKGIGDIVNQSATAEEALEELEQASIDYWKLRRSSSAE